MGVVLVVIEAFEERSRHCAWRGRRCGLDCLARRALSLPGSTGGGLWGICHRLRDATTSTRGACVERLGPAREMELGPVDAVGQHKFLARDLAHLQELAPVFHGLKELARQLEGNLQSLGLVTRPIVHDPQVLIDGRRRCVGGLGTRSEAEAPSRMGGDLFACRRVGVEGGLLVVDFEYLWCACPE